MSEAANVLREYIDAMKPMDAFGGVARIDFGPKAAKRFLKALEVAVLALDTLETQMTALEPPWHPQRDGLRYVLSQRVWSNFAGSAYRFARDDGGFVRRFWTHAAAQRACDELNEELEP